MTELKISICQGEFVTCEAPDCGQPVNRHGRRFCSRACYVAVHLAVRPACIRDGCERPTTRAENRFCSQACGNADRARPARPTKICTHCKQVFERPMRLDAKRWEAREHCARACLDASRRGKPVSIVARPREAVKRPVKQERPRMPKPVAAVPRPPLPPARPPRPVWRPNAPGWPAHVQVHVQMRTTAPAE